MSGGYLQVQEIVGNNVRRLRIAARLTQTGLGQQLASILGPAWEKRQTVSAAENGKRSWSAADLFALAYFFGVSIDTLFKVPPETERFYIGSAEITVGPMFPWQTTTIPAGFVPWQGKGE